MPRIHFLNVKQGDCHIIHHVSERFTVVDVCNAFREESAKGILIKAFREALAGNYGQKDHPENPISYLKKLGCTSVFRFVLTHPDMDHMDGLKEFFEEFSPTNFWDTANTKEKPDFTGGQYAEEDWDHYQEVRESEKSPKVLQLLAGATGSYYNQNPDGKGGGDGLQILAPTQDLVDSANDSEDFNDASYVILYRTGNRRIVFAGDSHDKTWESILGGPAGKDGALEDIDLLIAPHHGRDSDMDFSFLDVLRPKLSLFGNAPSGHLAYSQWNSRELPFITNNQAGNVVVDILDGVMAIYVSNEKFAKDNGGGTYNASVDGYFLGNVP